MNLSIILTDFINIDGILKTYRFIPINPYNKIVVDRISDIHTDIRENTNKDIGLLRVYNSDKCELCSTTCKLKNFFSDKQKIRFQFEHMYVPVEHSGCGSMGIYNFVLPIGYKLTDIHIVDPFDKANNCIEKKKHFRYSIAYDKYSELQIVQMELRSGRGSFSFIVKGEATIKEKEKYLDYEEREIFLDSDIHDYFFDDGIKKSFWQNLKDSLLLEPNFNGIGIDLKKLFGKHN